MVLGGAEAFRPLCKWNEPSLSLTELSGVPAEIDGRMGELRTVFSRTYTNKSVKKSKMLISVLAGCLAT